MARRTTINRDEALSNPGKVNAEVDAALKAVGNDEFPVPPEPSDDLVNLPGGITIKGQTLKTATVRELNGSDEEALSRALRSGNPFHFLDTLITRATETVGTLPATPDVLSRLLIGDRDELALAIRAATYGEDFEIERWVCPACQKQSDIKFSLKDVERHKLDRPEDATFEVELRKGAKAKVTLPNGAIQESLFENPDWTTSERNTKLLTMCIQIYTDSNGQEHHVAAYPSIVLSLSIPDRQKIIAEISNRQPGPRYNEVKFTHNECGNEVVLTLGLADLFRELVLFL